MYEDCGRLFELGECASLAVYYLQNLLQKLEWVACIKSRRSRADEISEYIRSNVSVHTFGRSSCSLQIELTEISMGTGMSPLDYHWSASRLDVGEVVQRLSRVERTRRLLALRSRPSFGRCGNNLWWRWSRHLHNRLQNLLCRLHSGNSVSRVKFLLSPEHGIKLESWLGNVTFLRGAVRLEAVHQDIPSLFHLHRVDSGVIQHGVLLNLQSHGVAVVCTRVSIVVGGQHTHTHTITKVHEANPYRAIIEDVLVAPVRGTFLWS
jgi:hypothetical protein